MKTILNIFSTTIAVLLIATITLTLFSACTGKDSILAPPPLPPNFCNHAGDRAESVLLKTASKMIDEDKVYPDQVLNRTYWTFVRLSAVTMVFDEDTKDFIVYVLLQAKKYYKKLYPSVTPRDLIDFLLDRRRWGAKVDLIQTILVPGWQYYHKVIETIKPWDHCAVSTAYKHFFKILKVTDEDIERIEKKYAKKYPSGTSHVTGGDDRQYDGYILGRGYWLK